MDHNIYCFFTLQQIHTMTYYIIPVGILIMSISDTSDTIIKYIIL